MRKRLGIIILLCIMVLNFSSCSVLPESVQGIVEQIQDKVERVLQNEPEEPPLNPELYPYYATLELKEKVVYYDLLQSISKGYTEIQPTYKLQEEAVKIIAEYIGYDQPQCFWYDGTISYSYDRSTGEVIEINPLYNDLADNLEENKAKVEKVKKRILKKISDMKKPDAERYCHDYLAKNVKYKSGKYDQNLYSALVLKKSVCAGITRAFQYLMMERDIPCYFCLGTCYTEETKEWSLHSWNILKLKGGYYNVDLTWDDFCNEKEKYPSAIYYNYYNVTDKKLSANHTRDAVSEILPECDATERSYKNYYGHSWYLDLKEQLELEAEKPISDMTTYYDMCKDAYKKRGTGNHTITFLVKGRKLMKNIGNLDKDAWKSKVMRPVADSLGMDGWSYSVEMQYWEISSESNYFYVEQEMSLKHY